MTARDRQIRVTGERREAIDVHRLADLLVRMARSGRDFTANVATESDPDPQRSGDSDEQRDTAA